MDDRPSVLFLCTGNSCRSQMAEGWLRHLAGDRLRVYSAGTRPAGVHPRAIAVMAEVGVDISGHTSDLAERYTRKEIALVVTVCGRAAADCPTWHAAERIEHWPFEDPVGATGTEAEVLGEFRRVRDQIRARIETWLASEGLRGSAPAQ